MTGGVEPVSGTDLHRPLWGFQLALLVIRSVALSKRCLFHAKAKFCPCGGSAIAEKQKERKRRHKLQLALMSSCKQDIGLTLHKKVVIPDL